MKHSYVGEFSIQTDGAGGSAGYNAVTPMGGATLSMSRDFKNMPRRATEYKTGVAGQIDIEVTGQLTWDDADTQVLAMETAFLNNTNIGGKFLDETSGVGLTADWLITRWDLEQPEDGGQMVSFAAKPTYAGTAPSHDGE
jgi:hypothetical protein